MPKDSLNTIHLKMSKAEFTALISCIDTLSSVMGEDDTTKDDIKLFDKMIVKNGYKRKLN